MDHPTAFQNTTLNEAQPSQRPEAVTMQQFYQFVEGTILLRVGICVMGMWTNALNIRAFVRIGLTDNMTIVFFSLAISDFVHLLGGLIAAALAIAMILSHELKLRMEFPPGIIDTLLFIPLRGFCEITYLCTTFLALQRCLCVAKPLHFKGMFTKFRTYVILAAIWVFSLTFAFALLYYSSDIKKVHDPVRNSSIYMMFFRRGRDVVINAYTTTFSIVLNTSNQLVVTVCVFVMAHVLNKSVRFRQKTSALAGNINADSQKNGADSSGRTQENKPSSALTGKPKEKQAVVQVSLVCLIFLACNAVRLAFAFTVILLPGFDFYGRYVFTFYVCYLIMILVEHLNSSINFFIYYKYNSGFRNVCLGKKVKNCN